MEKRICKEPASETDLAEQNSTPVKKSELSHPLKGACLATLAYSFWGLVPLYWKLTVSVPPIQMVAHRVLWSVVALVPLLLIARQWATFIQTLRERQKVTILFCTASLVSLNWFAFVWAVHNKFVLQSSLGYFITPLVNVVLARIILGERLRRMQWIAFMCAAMGVIVLSVQVGSVPWVALFLAVTFSLYGLVRKMAPVDPMVGLSVETVLLMPIAFGYLAWTGFHHQLVFFRSWEQDGIVALAGPITSVPLIWFASAGKLLRYSTLGFFQYISPTLQLLLAVFAYHERFGSEHLIAFVSIWLGIAIYISDTVLASKRKTS